MLRNRSRTMASSKQAPKADHVTLSSPKNHIISSFLGSPRFFNDYVSKNGLDFHQISDRFYRKNCCNYQLFSLEEKSPRNIYDPENLRSPNSILETKQFSKFVNPFGYDPNLPNTSKNKHTYEKLDSEGVGLAIIDSMKDQENEDEFPKTNKKMVLFGSKLKVQIPPLPPYGDSFGESPSSPADFGTKTHNSRVMSPLSVSCSEPRTPKNPFGSKNPRNHVNGKLSLDKMEQSEGYTCVVTHGPNPRTIHIFDDCVMYSAVELSEKEKLEEWISKKSSNCSPLNFLRFCHACKDKLEDGKDIYMYRGEMAFCSHECRCQQMLCEGENNSKMYY